MYIYTGAAGQSFCAFNIQGVEVTLTGYANDYVCKGMAGGKVVVTPSKEDDEACLKAGRGKDASQHSVVGNTVLYGATGGSLLVRGRGGERFAVRNSGAIGVVEGLGDHGCEYMTAGVIMCLGNTGRNFGAGMTGGLAFVIDDEVCMDTYMYVYLYIYIYFIYIYIYIYIYIGLVR
jgi:glutamate synthase (NADPH/NADH) large chain